MSILINKSSKILVQGITGSAGSFHAKSMIDYGTNIVAGVSPGKGGLLFENNIPIFDSVEDAVIATSPDVSIIFVPAPFAADAILESMASEIKLCVCITEGIPIMDMLQIKHALRSSKTRLIGPNCPGIITPDECKVGIMPGHIHRKGKIGVISRSGTLTYEAVHMITQLGLGQSTCIGIGGDPIIGTSFIDALTEFNNDEDTETIVIIGEIGGSAEEDAALWIKSNIKNKNIVGFIAGVSAPVGKRMGHAGAIISGNKGSAQDKIKAFKAANIKVAITPVEISTRLKEIYGL